MTQLHAQPYDISATGFFFESHAEYNEKARKNINSFGFPVEEYEIQFIDGEAIDAHLFKSIGVNQCDICKFLEACDAWDEHQKQKVIIAAGECGYRFNLDSDNPDDLEIDIYEVDSMRELAMQFVEEGLLGEIPERLQYYLDYDAIAGDMSMEYAETTISGKRLVYRAS